MYHICTRYNIGHTTNEDLMQEGFLRIYKDIKQYDPDRGAFYPWAKKVMINSILESARKRSKYSRIVPMSDTGVEEDHSTKDKAISNLTIQELKHHIDQLPHGYKSVFCLHVIDGYKHHEIASMLAISVGTSKSQLLKARKKLAESINSVREVELRHAK